MPLRGRPGIVLCVLGLATLSYALQQSLVVPALPRFQQATGVSEATASWIFTAALLSAAVATPIIGRLGDMYGKDRVLLLPLGLLTGGTVLCATASSIEPLIAGRVIQGAGGGMLPLAFGVIRDTFPRRRVAGAIGIVSGLMGVGSGAGVLLAGPVLSLLSHDWLFWITLPASVVSLAAVRRLLLPSPRIPGGRLNWRSAGLMSLGLVALLVAITKAAVWGWWSQRTGALLALGLLLLAAWVRSEWRADQPLVDMRTMGSRGVWTTNVAAALLGAGMYSSYVLLPQFVQAPGATGYGFDASVAASGLVLLPLTTMLLVLGMLAGPIEARFGSERALLAGALWSLLAWGLLAVAHGERWEVHLAAGLLGVGNGLALAALAQLIVRNVRSDQTGVATGVNSVVRMIGGAIGVQLLATILAANPGPLGFPSEAGWTLAFVVGAGFVLCAALVALLASSARREPAVSGGAAEVATTSHL